VSSRAVRLAKRSKNASNSSLLSPTLYKQAVQDDLMAKVDDIYIMPMMCRNQTARE
jgi:hypothetical protein